MTSREKHSTPWQAGRLRPAALATPGLALSVAGLLCGVAQAEGFRVHPYLQQPSAEGMYLTWFSESDTQSRLEVEGPGLESPLVFDITPELQPVLNYTEAEKSESIEGLQAGEWLLGERNYKHAQAITGLQPGETYTYRVSLGDSEFSAQFRTAPQREDWQHIRFMVFSDSETEPRGRVRRRDWQQGALAENSQDRPDAQSSHWAEQFGTTGSRLLYMLTETQGYQANLDVINSRAPDFLMMPGDLVQGGGYQPGWDEFFRHNAGEYASGLSTYPLLPALGNWENYGALNGKYGKDAEGRFGPKLGRDKYHVYFDAPDNGTPEHRDNYYRIDYGPVTLLTLDSSNGEPDDARAQYGEGQAEDTIRGQDYTGPGTDTQENFSRAQYEAEGGEDLADFNPGSVQWRWVEKQLKDAREQGQIIFAQFHHAPYSSGTHGFPMNHEKSSGQGGTPMRQYHPLFEQYGVLAVFSGHSEMFERSFVDEDGDGVGVHYYDVGVAGDGLRGEARDEDGKLIKYNPYSQWTADQDEPELWQSDAGLPRLVQGGKHYGHLEVNVERAGDDSARVTLTPVHVFPVLEHADKAYQWSGSERRELSDSVVVQVAVP